MLYKIEGYDILQVYFGDLIMAYTLRPALYVMSHGYLNTMQVGIQSGHVIAEMAAYLEGKDQDHFLIWAKWHKVLCYLNGGTGQVFDTNYSVCKYLAKKYNLPFAMFKEPDINDMITAFGIVLYPNIIEELDVVRQTQLDDPDDLDLVEFLSAMPRAR
jgi:hypothetical protein